MCVIDGSTLIFELRFYRCLLDGYGGLDDHMKQAILDGPAESR